MKKRIIKIFMGKFSGPITSWATGAVVAYLLSLLVTAPEWALKLLNGLVEALTSGQFTEINAASLTLIIAPIIASLMQAGINYAKTSGIEKIQEANGSVVDGWVGENTIRKSSKK
tara:strand:+ start:2316 stop:2660 length:345 start_codon:yes stop_codon:yes gene_type:complete